MLLLTIISFFAVVGIVAACAIPAIIILALLFGGSRESRLEEKYYSQFKPIDNAEPKAA